MSLSSCLFSIIFHSVIAFIIAYSSVDFKSAELTTIYELSLINDAQPLFQSRPLNEKFQKLRPNLKSVEKSLPDLKEPDQNHKYNPVVSSSSEILRIDLSSEMADIGYQNHTGVGSNELARFISSLLKHIESKLKYPESAKEREIEGCAYVEILLKNREIYKVSIYKSSGSEILDTAALKGAESTRYLISNELNYTKDLVLVVPVKFTLSN